MNRFTNAFITAVVVILCGAFWAVLWSAVAYTFYHFITKFC